MEIEDIKQADVLGTIYRVERITDSAAWPDLSYDGCCNVYSHMIHYLDHNALKEWQNDTDEAKEEADKQVLRHELIHAFLAESGLRDETHKGWAANEEMVDWFACLSPKIFKLFSDMDLL